MPENILAFRVLYSDETQFGKKDKLLALNKYRAWKICKKNKQNVQTYVEKTIKLENIRHPLKKNPKLMNIGPTLIYYIVGEMQIKEKKMEIIKIHIRIWYNKFRSR